MVLEYLLCLFVRVVRCFCSSMFGLCLCLAPQSWNRWIKWLHLTPCIGICCLSKKKKTCAFICPSVGLWSIWLLFSSDGMFLVTVSSAVNVCRKVAPSSSSAGRICSGHNHFWVFSLTKKHIQMTCKRSSFLVLFFFWDSGLKMKIIPSYSESQNSFSLYNQRTKPFASIPALSA